LSSLLDLSNCDPRDDTNTVPVMDDIATMCHASTTPPNSSTVLAVSLQDREPSSLCGPAALVAALGLLLEFASQYDDVSTVGDGDESRCVSDCVIGFRRFSRAV
jgi:hypothetical protein